MAAPNFRINWTIPAPVILAILAQAAILAFVVGSTYSGITSTMRVLETRVAVLEKNAENNVVMTERVKGVEVRLDGIEKQSTRIEDKLDKALEGRK